MVGFFKYWDYRDDKELIYPNTESIRNNSLIAHRFIPKIIYCNDVVYDYRYRSWCEVLVGSTEIGHPVLIQVHDALPESHRLHHQILDSVNTLPLHNHLINRPLIDHVDVEELPVSEELGDEFEDVGVNVREIGFVPEFREYVTSDN